MVHVDSYNKKVRTELSKLLGSGNPQPAIEQVGPSGYSLIVLTFDVCTDSSVLQSLKAIP